MYRSLLDRVFASHRRSIKREQRKLRQPAVQRQRKLAVEMLEDRRLLALVTVDTTDDENDGDTSSIANLIATPGGTGISLREAIIAANNTAGADDITLPAGTYTLTIAGQLEDAGATGDLDISDDLTITGAGAATTIVQAGTNNTNGIDRVFDVIGETGIGIGTPSTFTVTTVLEGMTIRFGNPNGVVLPNLTNLGGGVALRGDTGLKHVTIRDSEVTDNHANGADAGGIAAGTHIGDVLAAQVSTLVLENTDVTNNTADASGGGIYAGNVTLQITGGSISGNQALISVGGIGGGGVGIAGNMTDVDITSSTISNNSTAGDGGGVGVLFDDPATTVDIHFSRIVGNTATVSGSALFNNNLGGGATFNAENNWFGSNASPAASISGTIDFDPWLVLTHTASPDTILTGGMTTLTASLTENSDAVDTSGSGAVPAGIPIVFDNPVLGSLSGADTMLTAGMATATFTAGGIAGAGSADATVDSQTIAAAITINSPTFDFGDAPDSYATVLGSDGARHAPTGVRLGGNRDEETDAEAPLDGTGDDANGTTPDDEDGVVVSNSFTIAPAGTARASVDIQDSVGTANLYAWIDFNGNGSFADAGEQIADGTGVFSTLGNGVVDIDFIVPATGFSGATFARFRVSSDAGLNFDGLANDGEVEDYSVTITTPAIVYVDDDFAGLNPGDDPAGPATAFGFDAFDTIQQAVEVVAMGGTIIVDAGTYQENVVLNKQVDLLGAQAGVDARGRAAAESIIETAGAPGTGILIELQTGSSGSIIDGFTFGDASRGVESTSGSISDLQLLNNRFIGATGAAVFLNNSGDDITVDQNVFDGTTKTGGGGLFHLDTDSFDGFHFTNNWLQNDALGTGLFVDGNHNVGASAGRAPLIQGNLVQGNATGMNLGTRAFEFGSIVENTFNGNIFDGLQGGIQNSMISRNTFSNNGRWGLALTSFGNMGADRGAQNNMISENEFFANVNGDVLFSSLQAPGTISTNTLIGNSLGSATGVSYSGTEIIDASANWWDTNDEAAVRAKIGGAGAANVDSTPFLDNGADTDLVMPGFQGDFSTLQVTLLGAQAQVGGRINEAIGLVTASEVIVNDGVYDEDVLIDINDLNLHSVNGAAATTINGQALGAVAGAVKTIVGVQNATIGGAGAGFTINGAGIAGIYLSANNDGHLIQDNIVTSADGQNALLSEGGQSNHTIQDNMFGGNASQLVYINGTTSVGNASDNVDFLGNQFGGNATGPLLGQEADNSLIQGNNFTGTSGYTALEMWGDGNTVDDSTFIGAGVGQGLLVQNTVNTFTLNDSSISGYAAGGTITDVATVHWAATDQDDTLLVDGQASQISASGDKPVQAIDFAGVTTLNVDSRAGDDTVTVSPHATTEINLDGNIPNAPLTPPDLGDTLVYVSTGAPHTFGPATIMTSGLADINHVNFENFSITGALVVGGTGDDDTLEVNTTNVDSGTYQLTTNGVAGPVVAFSGISSLIFNGLDGDDQLIINNDPNNVLAPAGGIFFNGGGQANDPAFNPAGDRLIFDGAANFAADTVVHRLDPSAQPTEGNDGQVAVEIVALSLSSASPLITYTGLEPIIDTIMATDRIFSFTAGAETVTLSDDGDPGDGESLIDSTLGESVIFTHPSGTLTIDTTAGGGNDQINIEGLDSLFDANLTILGDGDDALTFQNNATNLGAGNLIGTAGNIAVNAFVSTTGDATLTALTGDITDDVDDGVANLLADVIHLTLASGGNSIGVSPADRFEIDANVLQVTAGAGGGNDAFLVDVAGGVAMRNSSVNAGGNVLDLQAENGNITSETVDGIRDVLAGILVLETTGGGTIGTGVGDRLEINATTRFDAITAGGSIFVLDPDSGLPIGSVSAPGALVDLLATAGPITDANGASNNVAAANLVASATTGIDLDTAVDTVIAQTTGAGHITLNEADAVTLVNVNSNDGNVTIDAGGATNAVNVVAGGGGDVDITTTAGDINVTSIVADGDRVTLAANGSILDASGAVTNVTGLEAVFSAGDMIGSAVGNGPLNTAVSLLEAVANGGGVRIDNSLDLTIGGIGPMVGLGSTDTIVVRNEGRVDITEHVTADVDIEIVSLSLVSVQPITVVAGVTVGAGFDVELRSSDDLFLQDSSTVQAGNQVRLFGDFGDVDPNGAVINLFGTITSPVQAIVQGNVDNDMINLNPGVTHSADSILLDGAGGDDQFFIQMGRLNGGANAVEIVDSGVGDNDTATVNGTAADEDITVHNNVANGVNPQTGGFVDNSTIGETVQLFANARKPDRRRRRRARHVLRAALANRRNHHRRRQPDLRLRTGRCAADSAGRYARFSTPLGNTFFINGKTIFTNGGVPNPFMGVNFISIENMPFTPLGADTLRFDMDFGVPNTAAGFYQRAHFAGLRRRNSGQRFRLGCRPDGLRHSDRRSAAAR